jgi:hypothetical protein
MRYEIFNGQKIFEIFLKTVQIFQNLKGFEFEFSVAVIFLKFQNCLKSPKQQLKRQKLVHGQRIHDVNFLKIFLFIFY